MLVDNEVFIKLDGLYQNEIKKLENDYSTIDNNDLAAKKACLLQFSQTNFMIPELWNEYFSVLRKERQKEVDTTILVKLIDDFNNDLTRARNHFFIHEQVNDKYTKLWNQKLPLNDTFFLEYNEIMQILALPCKGIDQIWRYFDEKSPKPLPAEAFKLYNKTKELYTQILKAEVNDQEWAYYITQVPNTEYVENNFEWRIGKNVHNQILWKLYLQYLQEHDIKRSMHLYSCYCRFFISDIETKNAYKIFVEKYGISIVPWKNPYEFEKFEEEIIDEEQYSSPVARYYPKITKNLKKFSAEGCKSQSCSFPKTFLDYMIQRGKPNAIQKLHKTCKYFFITFSYPVFHRLCINHSHPQPITPNYFEYFQQSLCLSIAWYQPTSNFIFKHKFIISNSLYNASPELEVFRRNSMKKIIKYVFRCYAKHIEIREQDLTLKELKILFEEGCVEKLILCDNKITDENDEEIKLQDILQLTPNLKYFEITAPNITEETFYKLSDLKFNNKIKIFTLRDCKNCGTNGIAEFLKEHFNQNSKFLAYFDKNTDLDTVKNIYTVIKKEFKSCRKNGNEPQVVFLNRRGQNYGILDE